jgi:hypothetical protein
MIRATLESLKSIPVTSNPAGELNRQRQPDVAQAGDSYLRLARANPFLQKPASPDGFQLCVLILPD